MLDGVSLFLRGVLWFGLYVLVTVLPLGLALWGEPATAGRAPVVEFSVALGLMAFSITTFQFALVSRLRASSRPFGTDALIQFHQQMGLAVLLFALAHPLLLARHGVGLSAWSPFTGPPLTQTGAVALWAMVIVVLTSVWRKRLRLSYEGWQILHLATSVVIVGVLVGHVLARGASRAPWAHGILIAYAAVFLALAVRYRLIRPLLLARRPWEVLQNADIGGSTRLLRLRPIGHDGFRFDPGQFAWLITGRSPAWSQQHPLSLASSAEPAADGSIEFSIKALGDWSGRVVPGLAPGARVWVDGPFGAFTPERAPGQGFVLFAGGIGIAPMRSMLLTMRDRGDGREILLIDAVHDPTRLLFGPELDDLARTLHLRVVHVFEEPPKGWTGERGHITADLLRRHLPSQFLHFQYFVCGPVPMMDALESILTDLSIPAAAVHTERFEMV